MGEDRAAAGRGGAGAGDGGRAHPARVLAGGGARARATALGGTFAALSVWERELGRLRVLVNAGERAAGEEEFPEDEAYPVHQFPEITEFLHERWAGGGEPHAWVETADGAGRGPSGAHRRTATSAWRPCAGAGAAAAWSRRSCCTGGPGASCTWPAPAGAPVFDRDDADFATVLAAVVAAGIAQTERLEEVRRLAFTDPLTGLANRRAVDIRLDEALERHRADGIGGQPGRLRPQRPQAGQRHPRATRSATGCWNVSARCCRCAGRCCRARSRPGSAATSSACWRSGPAADEVVRVADELCRRAAELELGEGVACGVASTGDPIGPVRSARRLFRLADAAQYRAKAARSREAGGRRARARRPVIRLADAAARALAARAPPLPRARAEAPATPWRRALERAAAVRTGGRPGVTRAVRGRTGPTPLVTCTAIHSVRC